MFIFRHSVVFHRPGIFAAWPANNGLWVRNGSEALVGFVTGRFKEQEGHNLLKPYDRSFARTTDGGTTWTLENPVSFPAEGTPVRDLTQALPWKDERVILRFFGEGYHGSSEGKGAFAVSRDFGRTWEGPFRLGEVLKETAARDWEVTARTAYLRSAGDSLTLFLSARLPGKGGTDRAFAARMTAGGTRIEFLGWIVSPQDPYRAVMPSPVRLSDSAIVAAVRRRRMDKDVCWVDLYRSEDAGTTWGFLSRVGETGNENGNPPALIRLADGRLCCAYGNRAQKRLVVRLSRNDGRTWEEERTLREDFRPDRFGDADFGYPQMFQRPDGKIVTIYYWASADHPEHFIASTLWEP
ncbi:MAG: sialidase family protein [Capsulimonadales bacterium]|nr:sialidase family protein [Capsulimonadales bacterium]